MKTTILFLLATFFFSPFSKPKFEIKYRIETALGDVTVELYPDKAPVTVANFMHYADKHLYNGTTFYRVCTPENEADREVKIEVVQGGEVPKEKCRPPIFLETTRQTTLSHLDGTISMARDAPNSATSSFFICIGDQPELNYGGKRNPDGQGFAAFGRVIEGMDVVRKIQQLKEKDQYMVDPVAIIKVKRLKK